MIAAITSCTNTSNPSVMIGAGLLAKNAVERGLASKPWVKTSLAPGSRVVTDYYDRAGLTPYLDKLGFALVGYGCTTCIGNSGPLIQQVSDAVTEHDLTVCSVLSGNRNFEGRIHAECKMNFLTSPPLVIAYALAGTMDVDLLDEPLGARPGRTAGLPARHLAHARSRSRRSSTSSSRPTCSRPATPTCSRVTTTGASLEVPAGEMFAWQDDVDVRAQPAVLRRDAARARAVSSTSWVLVCWPCSATR